MTIVIPPKHVRDAEDLADSPESLSAGLRRELEDERDWLEQRLETIKDLLGE